MLTGDNGHNGMQLTLMSVTNPTGQTVPIIIIKGVKELYVLIYN